MDKTYVDHLQRRIHFAFPPKRIISLCPSITETLFAFGLAEEMVGRTRYCIHPADQVEGIPSVGGTKKVKEGVIKELCPDLIIAEKEENTKEIIESLSQKYPVFVADVQTYGDALQLIHDLGNLTDRELQASALVERIHEAFKTLPSFPQCRVAYLIWKNPYMVAGYHTYIHSLLEKCGFLNVFKDYPGRYPTITEEDIEKESPDFIFLSSEPFPFTDIHKREFEKRFPKSKTLLVDGEIFSWHGVRMTKVPSYIQQLYDLMPI